MTRFFLERYHQRYPTTCNYYSYSFNYKKVFFFLIKYLRFQNQIHYPFFHQSERIGNILISVDVIVYVFFPSAPSSSFRYTWDFLWHSCIGENGSHRTDTSEGTRQENTTGGWLMYFWPVSSNSVYSSGGQYDIQIMICDV